MSIEELCVHVENRLGWVPLGDRDTALESAVTRIKDAQRKHPNIYATPNLEITVKFMQKERVFIQDPSDVLLYVKPALADAGLRYDWSAA